MENRKRLLIKNNKENFFTFAESGIYLHFIFFKIDRYFILYFKYEIRTLNSYFIINLI